MIRHSYGIIPFKYADGEYYFFVGHPGGNKYNKWSFMKGGMEKNEEPIVTAIREFREESGVDLSGYVKELFFLGTVQQRSNKVVGAYGIEFPDINPDKCHSNLCEKGWPEIDKYKWCKWSELKDITNPKHIVFYEKIIDNNGNH